MNKLLFRTLVVLMSLALIGITLVQVYWIKSSLDQSEQQFRYQVKQVIGIVSDRLEQNEMNAFFSEYNKLKDSIGGPVYQQDLIAFKAVQTDLNSKETILFSNTITFQDYNINLSFFDINADSIPVRSYSTRSRTEIFRNNQLRDNQSLSVSPTPDEVIAFEGELDALKRAQFEISLKNLASLLPIQSRISVNELNRLLTEQFKNYGIHTPFEFAIYSNSLATKVKSNKFRYNKETTFSIPVFDDYEDTKNNVELLVSFPDKEKYLFSDVIGITILSIIFTLIIIIAYVSALNQWIKQRKISEIKTDFINNMTHEFKTPIATINLALDAIKNPKIRHDEEKSNRYLAMIREENKRMHAQVENVLRISKLEKKEVDIEKEPQDVLKLLENAVEHVRLIVESREGTITKHLEATRTTALVNEVHFTNVLVNVLDNAIKYSPDTPIIDVYTENIKDYLLIKIKDKGQGMSKSVQKRVFEKFYREHTGDVHNVKGHGLGLAYVKKIVEDHNGQIYVESEKGKGSLFTIKLPLIN
jgi:two-component system phosphate regulon sensor histidine kinase PhoR